MTGNLEGVASGDFLVATGLAGLSVPSKGGWTGAEDISIMDDKYVLGKTLPLTIGEQPITQIFPDLITQNRNYNDDHDDGKQTVNVPPAFGL
jgi:hypothetical protein